MSHPTHGPVATRELPARPSLEHLKNEAKQRLDTLKGANPGTQLADAQFQLAREHGFASWRELKAEVDRRTGAGGIDPVGDWIGSADIRMALHVQRSPAGGYVATMDSPDASRYGFPVDEFTVEGDGLRLALLSPTYNALYEARWDAAAQAWTGEWRQNGWTTPLSFRRGTYPPGPTVHGLDGIWEGWLDVRGGYRLVFHVRTGPNGTIVKLDSPDRNSFDMPVRAVRREGDTVTFQTNSVVVGGRLDSAGDRIDATFTRDGRSWPLVLLRRTLGAPPLRRPAPPVVEVAPETLDAYLGRYAIDRHVMTVTAADGRLWSQMASQPTLELFPSGPDAFFWKELEGALTFQRDADGRVTGATLHAHGRDSTLPRIG